MKIQKIGKTIEVSIDEVSSAFDENHMMRVLLKKPMKINLTRVGDNKWEASYNNIKASGSSIGRTMDSFSKAFIHEMREMFKFENCNRRKQFSSLYSQIEILNYTNKDSNYAVYPN